MPKKKAKKRKTKRTKRLDENQLAARLVERTIRDSERQGAGATGNK